MARALVLGALTSAAVLIVAEFLTLYTVRVVRGTAHVPSVAAGTENHYALIPIALLGVALVLVAIRLGDRSALTAVAVLGLIALLIGLLHDLPDARRTGLVGSVHTGWVRGASSPSVGMYMETLGAVLLLLTAGVGLLVGERIAVQSPAEPPPPPEEPATAASLVEPPVASATEESPRPTPTRTPTPAAKRTRSSAAKKTSTPSGGSKRTPASGGSKRTPSSSGGSKRTPSSSKRTPSSPSPKRPSSSSAKRAPGTPAKGASRGASAKRPAK